MVAISVAMETLLGLTWPRWKRLIPQIEQMGFAGLFLSDHFSQPEGSDPNSLELIVALTYLADHSERLHFGPLVAPLSFRDPVMLRRQAIHLDDLSNGRMILGVGAGWVESEHIMFGYQLGNMPNRFARFAEGLEVITGLLRSDVPVSYAGQFYTLLDAILLPRPKRPYRPPILIGGNGPRRTLPLVARYADIWNGDLLTPAEFAERSAQLDVLIREAGRETPDVRRTMMFAPICRRDAAEIERRVGWLRRADESFTAMPLEELITMLRQHFKAFVGTPDELITYIQEFVAAGADEIMLQWGDKDDLEGLELLADTVLPHFAIE